MPLLGVMFTGSASPSSWMRFTGLASPSPWMRFTGSALPLPWVRFTGSALPSPWMRFTGSALPSPWMRFTGSALPSLGVMFAGSASPSLAEARGLAPRRRSARSIPLRFISLTGIRPMKKASQSAAFVQAQRCFLSVFFRTAHCLRVHYTPILGKWILVIFLNNS